MFKMDIRIKKIIFFSIILVAGIFIFIYAFNSRQNSQAIVLQANLQQQEQYTNYQYLNNGIEIEYYNLNLRRQIFVFITGEVYYPGVYTLYYGQRAFEAIEMAGGLTKYANENAVNLASILQDAQHIIIPHIDDDTDIIIQNNPESQSPALININTASILELQTLPGIGPARASSIVSFRERQGNFINIEGIMNISGIGNSLFNSIRDFITVN